MPELTIDIKRALSAPSFYLSALAMAGALALGAGAALWPGDAAAGLPTGYHAQLLLAALQSTAALSVLPILCTLPYCAAFLEEYESGYIKNYLLRCDSKGYIWGKCVAPVVSGGLSVMTGIALAWVLAALVYTPLELKTETVYPFPALLGYLLLYGLSGCLWAALGTLLANLSLSKYMAYASPFVFYYVLIMLQERYFTKLYLLNPKEWVLRQHEWPLGALGVALPIALVCVLLCYLNGAVVERRLGA